ncbi:S-layer domain protein [Gloeomargarita lithophora Alchichica-D10]|uniref:S-layer domain protein n=1 Tax=Gloeomargarita lithophora Alchichica-D10 TaxID=1188229 RepID=A0A1J0AD27_9CYAN|nr:S-layer homology domain-containing protein [Gloeomargarita lithophora]APB33815.1 S-layer domain protein [Gloeomargarita lithophora Alchichica-D10]
MNAIRIALIRTLGLGILIALAGCEGSGLERSLAPDPKLTSPTPVTSPTPKITDAPTPTPTPEVIIPEPSPTPVIGATIDLTAVPPALQPLVQQVLNLNVIPSAAVQLDQPVTRRQFARWLLAVQQRLYPDQIERQVRPATSGSTPLFADVPRSDPDFAAIQGLAEAGIIPSRFTQSPAPTRFQPDQPLNRATLVAWKVSLDVPGALPPGSVAEVSKLWGFQDAAKLNPPTLAALVADANHEPSTVRRVWGRTRLFLPEKPVSQAQALAALWSLGSGDTLVTAQNALK